MAGKAWVGNSANSARQIIVTPKGSGAQKGLAEKFASDLYTGTGNFTFHIALPAGRNGFQPDLNLVYSTGNQRSIMAHRRRDRDAPSKDGHV